MRRWILTVLLIALAAVLWTGARSWSSRMKLSTVSVHGARILTQEEIRKLAALHDSVLLKDVDLAGVKQRVERHPYVRRASVNRDFPSSIRITVDERVPLAVVVASRMVLIDDESVVLPVRHGEPLRDLAVITGSFRIPETGDTLRHRGVREALRMIAATRVADGLLYHLFSEIRIQDDGTFILYTTDGGVPVLLGDAITAGKLIALREFWLEEVGPVGSDHIHFIDMRFEDQIVTRWRTGGMRR